MSITKHQLARVLSAVLIAVLLIASGWIGFTYYGSLPTSDHDTKQTDSHISQTDLADDNTEPTEETLHIKTVKIKSPVAIFAEESTESDKLAVINKKMELEYISESDLFYKVKYAGTRIGWITKSRGEVTEKNVTVKHAPKGVSDAPFDLAQTKEGADIADILYNYSTMGASVAVIKNGRVAYHYEYGYANKENDVKVSENTKFRIASVSKVFTAMLAMAETDEGVLDLDKDLSEIMGFKVCHPAYSGAPVTTRMLLTHSAGLKDKSDMFSKSISSVSSDKRYYASKPGTRFNYSNLGIGIAGAVVEKSANKTISQYARDKFLEPMGIDASFDAKYLSDPSLVADCYAGNKIHHSSAFLTRSQERGKPGDVFHLGQGGLLISSEDLARLMTLLINDGQYDGRQYLSSEAVRQMLTRQDVDTKSAFDQCIGIRRYFKLVGKHDLYYHNGDSYGIYSLMAIDPADKSGVAVITSGAYAQRKKNTVFDVCDDVLNYAYGEILN